ncbi:unnamed protein product [Cercospora beticola]|nr:unnamed protein product [Cercospora beticola]
MMTTLFSTRIKLEEVFSANRHVSLGGARLAHGRDLLFPVSSCNKQKRGQSSLLVCMVRVPICWKMQELVYGQNYSECLEAKAVAGGAPTKRTFFTLWSCSSR